MDHTKDGHVPSKAVTLTVHSLTDHSVREGTSHILVLLQQRLESGCQYPCGQASVHVVRPNHQGNHPWLSVRQQRELRTLNHLAVFEAGTADLQMQIYINQHCLNVPCTGKRLLRACSLEHNGATRVHLRTCITDVHCCMNAV